LVLRSIVVMKKADPAPVEFEILSILWRIGCGTVKDIQTALAPKRPLARTTINTLLTRMRDKGFVEVREKNFAFEFRPLVERESVTRHKLSNLVDRILEGNIAPLAAYIVENRELTPDQIKALEEIVKSESGEEG